MPDWQAHSLSRLSMSRTASGSDCLAEQGTDRRSPEALQRDAVEIRGSERNDSGRSGFDGKRPIKGGWDSSYKMGCCKNTAFVSAMMAVLALRRLAVIMINRCNNQTWIPRRMAARTGMGDRLWFA